MTARIIILGAGRPFHGQGHSALQTVDRRGNVLDWLLAAFAPLEADVHFVGGYGIADIMQRFPHLQYSVNAAWQTSGSLRSLAEAGLGAGKDVYVAYSDIVFRNDVVDALRTSASDRISVAVDSERRATERPSREVVNIGADGEPFAFGKASELTHASHQLVGLVRIPAGLVSVAQAALDAALMASPKEHLSAWLQTLCDRGTRFSAYDLAGQWTDLDSEAGLAKFIFGTKAETLARMAGVLTRASVATQAAFAVREWRASPHVVLDRVFSTLPRSLLAVRSSALSEDGFSESNAGRFVSALNIECTPEAISAAISKVIASYDGDPDHQVLIQPMIQDVARSGVAFTRTLAVGAPYRVINYSEGDRTDVVTSGTCEASRVIYVHRGTCQLPAEAHPTIASLVSALDEIERLTELDTLDVEFAIDIHGECHLLQVRPLIVETRLSNDGDARIAAEIQAAEEAYSRLQEPQPGIVGRRTLFGVMPDWNPAEIVGVTPDPLAESLYRYLITDETWAVQRAEFGYRDVRHQPLIQLFACHPYVDVRASINSFVPAALPDDVAMRLVEAAVDRLAASPHLHDKLEFDVTLTCLDLDFEAWQSRLDEARLTRSEQADYRNALGSITEHAFLRCETTWSDLSAYAACQDRFIQGALRPLTRARSNLYACRRTGTLLFAHMARCGFVAMSLLRSAIRTGVVSEARGGEFLGSIRTVGHRLTSDAWSVRFGSLDWQTFVSRYSHLRPGTYDLASPTYGAEPDRYLRPLVEAAHAPATVDFAWTSAEARGWQQAMDDLGLPSDISVIDRFLRRATEGREEAKFVFTRALSSALDDIGAWAAQAGVSSEDVSYLGIHDILQIEAGALGPDTEDIKWRAHRNRQRMSVCRAMRLPPLIRSRDDFTSFAMPDVEPNFIGTGKVRAEVVYIEGPTAALRIDGTIALIDNADPGYDWLFGTKIAGLITAYGGANSHMAIRAAEFGLPAAIGVGEVRMEELRAARFIELNCGSRRIEVVR